MAMNWSDFIQNTAGQIIDTRLQVYKLEKTPQAYDAATGMGYTEGQRGAAPLAGVSPFVWVAGGAAVLVLAFVLLKD